MPKQTVLQQINKEVLNCTKCPLYKSATNGVPGEGNPNAEIAFVGEAPGFNEDRQGKPFVGRAGQLLEKGLKSLGMAREDVWIGNIIKHRPPNNRDPLPAEIEACSPYLKKQIETIKPKMIATLGRFSLEYFAPGRKISKDHGKLVKANGMLIYPLYHPAAALRNGAFMGEFVKDFKKIPEVLESINNNDKNKESNKNLNKTEDKNASVTQERLI